MSSLWTRDSASHLNVGPCLETEKRLGRLTSEHKHGILYVRVREAFTSFTTITEREPAVPCLDNRIRKPRMEPARFPTHQGREVALPTHPAVRHAQRRELASGRIANPADRNHKKERINRCKQTN